MKCFRTDNGGEFVNHKFKNHLTKCGIIHQTTTPGTPQQNGVAERMNRTIVERAKCLLFDAGLDQKYWAEAVATATYLINRSIASTTEAQPEAIWSNSPVDVSHLRIFGSQAYVHVQRPQRGKFEPNSRKMLLMGYCDGTKGYRLMNEITSAITTKSRDVKFLEAPPEQTDDHLMNEDKNSTTINDESFIPCIDWNSVGQETKSQEEIARP